MFGLRFPARLVAGIMAAALMAVVVAVVPPAARAATPDPLCVSFAGATPDGDCAPVGPVALGRKWRKARIEFAVRPDPASTVDLSRDLAAGLAALAEPRWETVAVATFAEVADRASPYPLRVVVDPDDGTVAALLVEIGSAVADGVRWLAAAADPKADAYRAAALQRFAAARAALLALPR